MASTSILWRRLDTTGHDACGLVVEDQRILLAGCAAFDFEGGHATLAYTIICDRAWRTSTALITGWVDRRPVSLVIQRDTDGGWSIDGVPCHEVEGCIDVDLGFTPSTNLLPIRRLALGIGEEAEVHAAWLSFPAMKLQRLDQIYRRTGPESYHYESGGGAFTRELTADDAGFVVDYPGLWRRETTL